MKTNKMNEANKKTKGTKRKNVSAEEFGVKLSVHDQDECSMDTYVYRQTLRPSQRTVSWLPLGQQGINISEEQGEQRQNDSKQGNAKESSLLTSGQSNHSYCKQLIGDDQKETKG